MNLIGKNIKKIRAVKSLSQTAFADLFDAGRANIGAYEEGRATPKIELIISIAKHFSIDLENILTIELTVNEISSFTMNKKVNDSKAVVPSKVENTNEELLASITKIERELTFLKEKFKEV